MGSVVGILTPRAVLHRLNVLRITFLDHQFERSSPLPPLPDHVLDVIYSHEVVLPPRRYIEQPGGQTLEGLFFMAALTKALGARRIFEFGTFNGITTWTLARNAPGADIDTLDLPAGATPVLEVEPTDQVIRGIVGRSVYDELPHRARINQLWSDSAVFDPTEARRGRFDLVYIDGAHSEPYVRTDTRNAFFIVSDSGVVVWDDYWRDVAGVAAVLHEIKDVGLYRVPRTRLVMHLGDKAAQRLSSRRPD